MGNLIQIANLSKWWWWSFLYERDERNNVRIPSPTLLIAPLPIPHFPLWLPSIVVMVGVWGLSIALCFLGSLWSISIIEGASSGRLRLQLCIVTVMATDFSCSIANCTKAQPCLPPEPCSYLYLFENNRKSLHYDWFSAKAQPQDE